MRIFIPGDLCGAPLADGVPAPWATVALTRARLAPQAPTPSTAGDHNERLAAVLQAAQAEERLGMARQIVRLGRLSAYERMAHLLVELHDRLGRAGLVRAHTAPLPLTQEMLADALGLSVVHTNRVLQQLRAERLIVLRAGQFTVPDREALAAAAGYDASL